MLNLQSIALITEIALNIYIYNVCKLNSNLLGKANVNLLDNNSLPNDQHCRESLQKNRIDFNCTE